MNDRTAYFTPMLCFLVGGLAGASVALLLAPQSGKDAREALRRKLHETEDSARELKDRVVRQGEQIRDRVVRQGEEIRDEAGRRVSAAASALAGNGADTV